MPNLVHAGAQPTRDEPPAGGSADMCVALPRTPRAPAHAGDPVATPPVDWPAEGQPGRLPRSNRHGDGPAGDAVFGCERVIRA